LAFFTVYLDDSGTAPDQPIVNASALIIPGAQILRLESHWNTFTKAIEIKDFHASACAASTSKDKQYAGWDQKKKSHVFMRVRQFCKKFGVQTFGFSVYKANFDAIVSEGYRDYLGGHYTWAVRHIVREIEEWRNTRRIKEPVQHIFDWQDVGTDSREEIDDVMGQMGEYYGRKLDWDFKERKLIPGLQCVDLIAWLTLQLGLNNFRDKPIEGLASECIKDFENYYPSGKKPPNRKWYQVATVHKPQLESWAKNEQSLSWFKDWYDRHPNRKVLLDARKKNRVPAL
jgi:hypothetical protein